MTADEELRARAVKRVKDRRGFFAHLSVYLIVNAILFAIWAMSGGGYYWPMWTAFGWGIGVAFHGFAVAFGDEQPTEAQIEREMHRLGGGFGGPKPA